MFIVWEVNQVSRMNQVPYDNLGDQLPTAFTNKLLEHELIYSRLA